MVQSKQELDKVKVLGNKIYLRDNIQKIVVNSGNSETEELFEADELVIKKENPQKQKILDNFDMYWGLALEKKENEKLIEEKKETVKTLTEKEYELADLKELVDELIVDNLGG